MDIVKDIHSIFVEKGLTLSIAESCTGGFISDAIVSRPGASRFFEAGVIAYSASAKVRLLKVGRAVIRKSGTVSEEAAREMAEGVARASGSDVGLAVTGSLGPDTIENTRIGLIFVAVSLGKETTSKGFIFDGSRREIKRQAAERALVMLYEAVSLWT